MINHSNNSTLKKNIALVLFLARKSLGYNHLDLVKITNITRPIISTIENGSANPTLDSLITLKSALGLSDELFLMNQDKFSNYKKELKINYSNYLLKNSKLHISENFWNQLLKLSDEINKPGYGKIVKICRSIVEANLNSSDEYIIQNSTVGASLGVIFQQDGFEDNLNFGFWFGKTFLY